MRKTLGLVLCAALALPISSCDEKGDIPRSGSSRQAEVANYEFTPSHGLYTIPFKVAKPEGLERATKEIILSNTARGEWTSNFKTSASNGKPIGLDNYFFLSNQTLSDVSITWGEGDGTLEQDFNTARYALSRMGREWKSDSQQVTFAGEPAYTAMCTAATPGGIREQGRVVLVKSGRINYLISILNTGGDSSDPLFELLRDRMKIKK